MEALVLCQGCARRVLAPGGGVVSSGGEFLRRAVQGGGGLDGGVFGYVRRVPLPDRQGTGTYPQTGRHPSPCMDVPVHSPWLAWRPRQAPSTHEDFGAI